MKKQRWFNFLLAFFLLIGLALFIVNGLLSPEGGRVDRRDRIVVTDDDLVQLDLVWRAKWQRPPTPEEMVAMVDSRIKEEILYREALALGLDRDDTIVKRGLAQKMEFLSEDVSAIQDPGADELKAWFDDNAESFALPVLRDVYQIIS
jgi:peptidyl-prolyl cis-trans isomerase C